MREAVERGRVGEALTCVPQCSVVVGLATAVASQPSWEWGGDVDIINPRQACSQEACSVDERIVTHRTRGATLQPLDGARSRRRQHKQQ